MNRKKKELNRMRVWRRAKGSMDEVRERTGYMEVKGVYKDAIRRSKCDWLNDMIDRVGMGNP